VSHKGFIVLLIEGLVFLVFLFFRTTAGEQFANRSSPLVSQRILIVCVLMMLVCLPPAIIAIVLDRKKWPAPAALYSAALLFIIMCSCA
jgi:hypothetical protein